MKRGVCEHSNEASSSMTVLKFFERFVRMDSNIESKHFLSFTKEGSAPYGAVYVVQLPRTRALSKVFSLLRFAY
jgi:hypothetical protein